MRVTNRCAMDKYFTPMKMKLNQQMKVWKMLNIFENNRNFSFNRSKNTLYSWCVMLETSDDNHRGENVVTRHKTSGH